MLQFIFQSFEECTQFTYYGSVGSCYTWETCSSVSTDSCPGGDCFSGDADCLICSMPGLCNGVQEGFAMELSEADCDRACQANANCEWYSYDASMQYCSLTSNCETIQTCEEDSCVYGQKGCLAGTGEIICISWILAIISPYSAWSPIKPLQKMLNFFR